MEIPTSRASTACSRVMAGSLAMFLVPQATFRFRMLLWLLMPTSTGTTWAPATWLMMLEAAWPFFRFSATRRVISCPVWVTPSSTTPLSAHMTTRARLLRSMRSLPVIPAICTRASSSLPRECRG